MRCFVQNCINKQDWSFVKLIPFTQNYCRSDHNQVIYNNWMLWQNQTGTNQQQLISKSDLQTFSGLSYVIKIIQCLTQHCQDNAFMNKGQAFWLKLLQIGRFVIIQRFRLIKFSLFITFIGMGTCQTCVKHRQTDTNQNFQSQQRSNPVSIVIDPNDTFSFAQKDTPKAASNKEKRKISFNLPGEIILMVQEPNKVENKQLSQNKNNPQNSKIKAQIAPNQKSDLKKVQETDSQNQEQRKAAEQKRKPEKNNLFQPTSKKGFQQVYIAQDIANKQESNLIKATQYQPSWMGSQRPSNRQLLDRTIQPLYQKLPDQKPSFSAKQKAKVPDNQFLRLVVSQRRQDLDKTSNTHSISKRDKRENSIKQKIDVLKLTENRHIQPSERPSEFQIDIISNIQPKNQNSSLRQLSKQPTDATLYIIGSLQSRIKIIQPQQPNQVANLDLNQKPQQPQKAGQILGPNLKATYMSQRPGNSLDPQASLNSSHIPQKNQYRAQVDRPKPASKILDNEVPTGEKSDEKAIETSKIDVEYEMEMQEVINEQPDNSLYKQQLWKTKLGYIR